MRRTLGACLILLAAVHLPTQAQQTPLIKPGDWVRVTAPRCSLLEEQGEFTGMPEDSLILMIGEDRTTCPVSAVSRMELFQGKRSLWKPSLVGAGVLGLAGAGIMSKTVSCIWEYDEKTNLCPVIGAGVGIATGLILGGAFAFIRGRDVWEDIPISKVRPSLFLTRGNCLHLRFSVPLRR
jgi:hypothetical protein